jgi:ribose transport system permease protein
VLLIATTLMGACNGFLVAYTKVPAFALTLGTFGIFQTGALVSSQATAVYVDDNDSYLGHLNNKTIIGTPLIFYVGVFVAILLWVFLRFIKDGRSMTTIGLNEIGSYYSGLRGKRIKILAFALSGFMSGLAGITIIAQSGSASPNGLGSDLLLPGIAAAIVGGTSILGGVTNPINVVFGSLIISMIPIVNSILGVTTQAQSLVYGLAIIVVAAGMLNTLKNMTVK